MPRDIHGRPVKSERTAEPMHAGAAKDKDSNPRAHEAFEPAASKMQEHHDRLSTIEARLGITHKPSGFKAEDQGGKEKVSAGKVTEKRGASYGRKRH